jgi:ferredoxin
MPSGLQFEADADETLVQASRRAGVAMPVSCRNGTCRTCRCRVLEGTVEHIIEWPGLSREEKAAGWILPCVARALSPLVIEAPEARGPGFKGPVD